MSSPRRPTRANSSSGAVRRDDRGLAECDFRVVHAPAVIPFEPRDPHLLAARRRVRDVIASFTAAPGELLHGVIAGDGVEGTDLDKALLQRRRSRRRDGSKRSDPRATAHRLGGRHDVAPRCSPSSSAGSQAAGDITAATGDRPAVVKRALAGTRQIHHVRPADPRRAFRTPPRLRRAVRRGANDVRVMVLVSGGWRGLSLSRLRRSSARDDWQRGAVGGRQPLAVRARP